MNQWDQWQKLVLYRLQENKADNTAIREAVNRIEVRLQHIEVRHKVLAAFVSAGISVAIVVIDKLM